MKNKDWVLIELVHFSITENLVQFLKIFYDPCSRSHLQVIFSETREEEGFFSPYFNHSP